MITGYDFDRAVRKKLASLLRPGETPGGSLFRKIERGGNGERPEIVRLRDAEPLSGGIYFRRCCQGVNAGGHDLERPFHAAYDFLPV